MSYQCLSSRFKAIQNDDLGLDFQGTSIHYLRFQVLQVTTLHI